MNLSTANNTIKVFIVDDHPAMRHGLSLLITREENFAVCGENGNSQEAFNNIQRENPDLLILDIGLEDGEKKGFELLSRLRENKLTTMVLIYSMHDEQIYAEKSLKMGANGYLMKQQPVRTIITAIQQILDSGFYISPEFNQTIIRRQFAHHNPGLILHNKLELLTAREQEILQLLSKGAPPREIAAELNLSPKTVEAHRQNIKHKLKLANASELRNYAAKIYLNLPLK
jgi:DNA-binding NarL/FixJ family response regulator